MNAIDAIMKRESVREYTAEQISNADLDTILEAGKSGPGSGAIHMSVIQNPTLLGQLNDAAKSAMLNSGIEFSINRASTPGYEPVYGAPTMIILSASDRSGVPNTSCSAENMLIAATALGLGSCYLMSIRGAFGGDTGQALKQSCGVPDGSDVLCAVITGFKAGDAFKSPAPKIRTVNIVK